MGGVSGGRCRDLLAQLPFMVRARVHGTYLTTREPASSDPKTRAVHVVGIVNGSIGGKAIESRH